MASKKKINSCVSLKFRPSSASTNHVPRGTKPIADQATVREVFLMVIIQACRKVLFVNPNVKLGVYLFALFVGSIIGDFAPVPKTYFSNKYNVLNQYFVKLSWGWTITMVAMFVILTSYTYCCGQKPRIKKHVLRLLIATATWYIWTSSFVLIENMTGFCTSKAIGLKLKCIKDGYKWISFEISGHSFILIFCSLFIIEEAKAIKEWTKIKDMIRNEQHARTSSDKENSIETPLQHITDGDFDILKESYVKFTPYINLLFIAMTMLCILWDVMLVATILYFHTMFQKMIGGLIAICMWYFLYHWFYYQSYAPGLPGKGTFKYQTEKKQMQPRTLISKKRTGHGRTTGQEDDVPMFMGMPLNALRKQTPKTVENSDLTKET